MVLVNAFSIQMLDTDALSTGASVNFTPVEVSKEFLGTLESAVGHQDTANVLGVKMNRVNVTLHKGDSAIVAQVVGGRLPEGSTTLPEGFTLKFFRVDVL